MSESNSQSNSQKNPKLIVVIAFDRGDDGELFPAFGPADQQSEDRAIRTAKALAAAKLEKERPAAAVTEALFE